MMGLIRLFAHNLGIIPTIRPKENFSPLIKPVSEGEVFSEGPEGYEIVDVPMVLVPVPQDPQDPLYNDDQLQDWVGNDNDLLNLDYYDYLYHLARTIPSSSILLHRDYAYDLILKMSGDGFSINIAYKNLFEDFFFPFIKDDELQKALQEEKDGAHNDFINAIFENPNRALKRTAKFIEMNGFNLLSGDKKGTEELIQARLRQEGKTEPNRNTASYKGSKLGRGVDMVATYHPITTTSLPLVRKYEYHGHIKLPTELRFGTQGVYGKYIGYGATVNLLFELWLRNQSRKKIGITHIYFNNLGLDRAGYEGGRERALTLELQSLETRHQNVAVITLPADKGMMSHHILKHSNPHVKTDIKDVKEKIREIATIGSTDETQKNQVIRDFYISPRVKTLLYDNPTHEREKINELIERSLLVMGFYDGALLTDVELMAVYFHFIKFELTNYIIQKLNPLSFNMSCKDAIDRGGVSSAYYNLMQSILNKKPMTKAEFAEALHAAPLMVKNRLMNDHEEVIRNALRHMVQAQSVKVPQWVEQWALNDFVFLDPEIEEPEAHEVSGPENVSDELPDEKTEDMATFFKIGEVVMSEKPVAVDLDEDPEDPEDLAAFFKICEVVMPEEPVAVDSMLLDQVTDVEAEAKEEEKAIAVGGDPNAGLSFVPVRPQPDDNFADYKKDIYDNVILPQNDVDNAIKLIEKNVLFLISSDQASIQSQLAPLCAAVFVEMRDAKQKSFLGLNTLYQITNILAQPSFPHRYINELPTLVEALKNAAPQSSFRKQLCDVLLMVAGAVLIVAGTLALCSGFGFFAGTFAATAGSWLLGLAGFTAVTGGVMVAKYGKDRFFAVSLRVELHEKIVAWVPPQPQP